VRQVAVAIVVLFATGTTCARVDSGRNDFAGVAQFDDQLEQDALWAGRS